MATYKEIESAKSTGGKSLNMPPMVFTDGVNPKVHGYSPVEAARKLNVHTPFIEHQILRGHLQMQSFVADLTSPRYGEKLIRPGDLDSLEELLRDRSPEAKETYMSMKAPLPEVVKAALDKTAGGTSPVAPVKAPGAPAPAGAPMRVVAPSGVSDVQTLAEMDARFADIDDDEEEFARPRSH